MLIDEDTPWASLYRGLWGLFARDPVSGENAPAGPMYNRDGSPRSSWYDPLGFAGLDKTPPPPLALQLLEENCGEIRSRQEELKTLIPQKANELQVLGMKMKGLEDHPHLAKIYALLQKRINIVGEELRNLRRERMENGALLQGMTQRLEQVRSGVADNPHAHIQKMAIPVEAVEMRYARAAETWAAISLSLMVFAIAGLVFFAPTYIWAGLALILILFVVTESILRGAFIQTVSRVTLILALLTIGHSFDRVLEVYSRCASGYLGNFLDGAASSRVGRCKTYITGVIMIHNPVIDAMMSRRSVRKFTSQKLDDETLETIVRAGFQAPFAGQLCSILFTRRAHLPFHAAVMFTICVDLHRMELVMARRGWKTVTNNLSLPAFRHTGCVFGGRESDDRRGESWLGKLPAGQHPL